MGNNQNKWEKLFDAFLEKVNILLLKRNDNDFKAEVRFGFRDEELEAKRFESAEEVFDGIDDYICMHIIWKLQHSWTKELKRDLNCAPNRLQRKDWLKYRDELKNNQFELDVIDMIYNHYDEIELENCDYATI